MAHGGVVDLQEAEGFGVEDPGGKRIVGEEQAEHAIRSWESVFGAAAFDGKGDVAADGVEKFEVALVVGVFVRNSAGRRGRRWWRWEF